MNIDKLQKNLIKCGYKVHVFNTSKEAVEYLSEEIKDTSVGIGGSLTVKEIGLYDELIKNNEVYWHWITSGDDTKKLANEAEVYITGANAISEDGEIVNIDGCGNRLAGQLGGGKRLYIVVGINKLCKDLQSAVKRARNIAAVNNCKRLNRKTPCTVDGKCHDCNSKERICCALLISLRPIIGIDASVVIINENIGG